MTKNAKTLFSDYFEAHRNAIIAEYRALLSFETISAEYSSKKEHFERCIKWIRKTVENSGFSVKEHAHPEHPSVLICEKAATSPDSPVLTIYHHYDVQPVDPVSEWTRPPFSGYIDEDLTVWGRGAQDNKGQLFFTLIAMQALHAEYGSRLPITIRLIIEGEEESGSTLLSDLIPMLGEILKSRYTMIIDMDMERKDTPAITFGARGLAALTCTLTGTPTDLHSGIHGGLAYNPLHALVEILASLRDPNSGRVRIDGFYDGITPISPSDRERLLPINEQHWMEHCLTTPTGGERALSMTERNWLQPTLEINGIHGGYGGPGTKTVIPKEAVAKLTCRLVPGQDPKRVAQLVQKAIESRTPEGIRCSVEIAEGMGKAIRQPFDSAISQALGDSMHEVFGADPDYILSGGSIPVLDILSTAVNGELVLWGTGLHSDCIHAPNEHFDLHRMKLGFLTLALTIAKLCKI